VDVSIGATGRRDLANARDDLELSGGHDAAFDWHSTAVCDPFVRVVPIPIVLRIGRHRAGNRRGHARDGRLNLPKRRDSS